MPLKTALRKTFLRPIASSSPGGQTAKISQSSTAIAIRTISAQAGWRSMNRLTPATRSSELRSDENYTRKKSRPVVPSPSYPPERPWPFLIGHSDRAPRHPSDAAREGLDRQYLFERRLKVVTPWQRGGIRSAPCRHWRRRSV